MSVTTSNSGGAYTKHPGNRADRGDRRHKLSKSVLLKASVVELDNQGRL